MILNMSKRRRDWNTYKKYIYFIQIILTRMLKTIIFLSFVSTCNVMRLWFTYPLFNITNVSYTYVCDWYNWASVNRKRNTAKDIVYAYENKRVFCPFLHYFLCMGIQFGFGPYLSSNIIIHKILNKTWYYHHPY